MDRTAADKALQASAKLVDEVTGALAQKFSENGKVSVPKMDTNQYVCYQLAWLTAEQQVAESFVNYAWNDSLGTSELEKKMAIAFAGETVAHIRSELSSKPKEFGLTSARVREALFSDEMDEFIQ
ncbi:MAG: acyl-CoA dehydrogenase, partial [Leptospiraceae bacterium]|nr:acyl-CoA dehydrogenase [Leptospiraceae bacterium]